MGAAGCDISPISQPDEVGFCSLFGGSRLPTVFQKDRRRELNGNTIYLTWSIWKEMNRRVVQDISVLDSDVAFLRDWSIVALQRDMARSSLWTMLVNIANAVAPAVARSGRRELSCGVSPGSVPTCELRY